jgi:hypothetical protein
MLPLRRDSGRSTDSYPAANPVLADANAGQVITAEA